jgi:hypothetical protein
VSASYNRVTCASGKAKETYSGGKRDLLRRKKRPTLEAKETYSGGKRDLLWRQKRPTQEAKETYSGGKRDLLRRQKRPTLEAKETYSYTNVGHVCVSLTCAKTHGYHKREGEREGDEWCVPIKLSPPPAS